MESMKDIIKNFLWFIAIFIVLMICSAISFNNIITEPLCEFAIGKNAAHPIGGWLLIYFSLWVGLLLISISIQLLFAGRYLNKNIDLIYNHQRSLNVRMCILKNNPLWAYENNIYKDWEIEDAKYEKELNTNNIGYKYFSYLWGNENED